MAKKQQQVFATVVFGGSLVDIEQAMQKMSKTIVRRKLDDGTLIEPTRVVESYGEAWSFELYRTPCKSANVNDVEQALQRLANKVPIKYRITSHQTLDYFA